MSGRFVVLVGVAAPGRGLRLSSGAGRSARLHWRPAGLVEGQGLAEAMVGLLCERSAGVSARVVPLDGLAAEVGDEEAERILDRLRNPTIAESGKAHELERLAAERLNVASKSAARGRSARRVRPGVGVEKGEPPVPPSIRPGPPAEPVARREPEPPRLVQRRSELDRRGGADRRRAAPAGLAGRVISSIERRVSGERRSGVDRREPRPLPVP